MGDFYHMQLNFFSFRFNRLPYFYNAFYLLCFLLITVHVLMDFVKD